MLFCVTHFLLRYQLAHVLYRVFRKVGDLARAHLIRVNLQLLKSDPKFFFPVQLVFSEKVLLGVKSSIRITPSS